MVVRSRVEFEQMSIRFEIQGHENIAVGCAGRSAMLKRKGICPMIERETKKRKSFGGGKSQRGEGPN